MPLPLYYVSSYFLPHLEFKLKSNFFAPPYNIGWEMSRLCEASLSVRSPCEIVCIPLSILRLIISPPPFAILAERQFFTRALWKKYNTRNKAFPPELRKFYCHHQYTENCTKKVTFKANLQNFWVRGFQLVDI